MNFHELCNSSGMRTTLDNSREASSRCEQLTNEVYVDAAASKEGIRIRNRGACLLTASPCPFDGDMNSPPISAARMQRNGLRCVSLSSTPDSTMHKPRRSSSSASSPPTSANAGPTFLCSRSDVGFDPRSLRWCDEQPQTDEPFHQEQGDDERRNYFLMFEHYRTLLDQRAAAFLRECGTSKSFFRPERKSTFQCERAEALHEATNAEFGFYDGMASPHDGRFHMPTATGKTTTRKDTKAVQKRINDQHEQEKRTNTNRDSSCKHSVTTKQTGPEITAPVEEMDVSASSNETMLHCPNDNEAENDNTDLTRQELDVLLEVFALDDSDNEIKIEVTKETSRPSQILPSPCGVNKIEKAIKHSGLLHHDLVEAAHVLDGIVTSKTKKRLGNELNLVESEESSTRIAVSPTPSSLQNDDTSNGKRRCLSSRIVAFPTFSEVTGVPKENPGHHDGRAEGTNRVSSPCRDEQLSSSTTLSLCCSQLRDDDVLCGRGGQSIHHPGNKRMRALISKRLPIYMNSTRAEKMKIRRDVIRIIALRGGRFLRKISDPTRAKTTGKTSVCQVQDHIGSQCDEEVKSPREYDSGDKTEMQGINSSKERASQFYSGIQRNKLERYQLLDTRQAMSKVDQRFREENGIRSLASH